MRPRLPKRKKQLKAFTPGKAAGAAGAGIAALLWHMNVESSCSPVEVWVGDGDLKDKVLPHVPSIMEQPYRPSPWATNTHAQTILGFMRGLSIDAKYRRQLIIAHDGGTLGLDWFQGSDAWEHAAPDAPILLVLHGINGGSHEGYCKWSCSSAYHRGWRSCALNYRGCNGLPLTSPRGYAASLTHDIHYAITSIKARFPKAPLFAVGYSLGALFLTKYLAEADHGLHASMAANSSAFEPFEGSGLVAAASVSSPICLSNNSNHLSKPWTTGYLYNLALALKVREFMSEHRASILAGANFDVDKAMACWTVGDIEDAGVPNTLGYRNRFEYYEHCSSLQYIPHIRTPTLFLNAKDDPFLGVLPNEECSRNPNTVLAATKHGGHVAFLQGWKPFGPAWMDHVVLQFLSATAAHYPAAAAAENVAAARAGAQEQRHEYHQHPAPLSELNQMHQYSLYKLAPHAPQQQGLQPQPHPQRLQNQQSQQQQQQQQQQQRAMGGIGHDGSAGHSDQWPADSGQVDGALAAEKPGHAEHDAGGLSQVGQEGWGSGSGGLSSRRWLSTAEATTEADAQQAEQQLSTEARTGAKQQQDVYQLGALTAPLEQLQDGTGEALLHPDNVYEAASPAATTSTSKEASNLGAQGGEPVEKAVLGAADSTDAERLESVDHAPRAGLLSLSHQGEVAARDDIAGRTTPQAGRQWQAEGESVHLAAGADDACRGVHGGLASPSVHAPQGSDNHHTHDMLQWPLPVSGISLESVQQQEEQEEQQPHHAAPSKDNTESEQASHTASTISSHRWPQSQSAEADGASSLSYVAPSYHAGVEHHASSTAPACMMAPAPSDHAAVRSRL